MQKEELGGHDGTTKQDNKNKIKWWDGSYEMIWKNTSLGNATVMEWNTGFGRRDVVGTLSLPSSGVVSVSCI